AVIGNVTQQNCELVVDEVGNASAPHESINGEVLCSEGDSLSDRLRDSFSVYEKETGRNRLQFGDSLITRTKQMKGAKTLIHLAAVHIHNTSIMKEPNSNERFFLKMQYREIIRIANERGARSIALPFLSLDFNCNLWHSQISGLQSLLPMLPAAFDRIVFVVDSQSNLNSFREIIGGGKELSMESSKQADLLCDELCNVFVKPPRQPFDLPPTAEQLRLIRQQKQTFPPRPHTYRPRRSKTIEIVERKVSSSVSPPTISPMETSIEKSGHCSISVVVGDSSEQSTEAIVTRNTDRDAPECGIDIKILCVEGRPVVNRISRAFHAYKEISGNSSLEDGTILPTWAEKIPGAKILLHFLSPSIKNSDHPTKEERWKIFQMYREILTAAADEEATSIALPLLDYSSFPILTTVLQAILSTSPSKFSRIVFCARTIDHSQEFRKLLGGVDQILFPDDHNAIELRELLCDVNHELPIAPQSMKKKEKKKEESKKIITIDGDIIQIFDEIPTTSTGMEGSRCASTSSQFDSSAPILLPSRDRVLKQTDETFQPAFYTDHLRRRSNFDVNTGIASPVFNVNKTPNERKNSIKKAENSELTDRKKKNLKRTRTEANLDSRSPNENSGAAIDLTISTEDEDNSPSRKRGRPRKSESPFTISPKSEKKMKIDENVAPTRRSGRTIRAPQKHFEFESI
ncbi:hypothetical protein PFISCL1PPCAC_5713, partial [Pristionchus fissidentatus]